jgi:AcrR family transcriptional regulator
VATPAASSTASPAAPAPAESDKPSGPRSRKGEQTRARLLDAAKQIFEEHGFLDARISDIAERAGLSHGSFYHYFESKEEIFREVSAAVDAELSEAMGSVILASSSSAAPYERIREGIRRHLVSYQREARIIGVIEQVSRYDDHVASARFAYQQRYRDQVADSIRWLQRRGLADQGLDARIAAAAIGAITSRFPEMWLVQHFVECDFDEAVEQLTRIIVNALGLKEL